MRSGLVNDYFRVSRRKSGKSEKFFTAHRVFPEKREHNDLKGAKHLAAPFRATLARIDVPMSQLPPSQE